MVKIPGYTEFENPLANKQGIFSFGIMTVIFIVTIFCITYVAIIKDKDLELYFIGIVALLCMVVIGYISITKAEMIQILSESNENSEEIDKIVHQSRRNGYVMAAISIMIIIMITSLV